MDLPPAGLIESVGLAAWILGGVCLSMFGLLVYLVRRIINGKLVPEQYLIAERERGEEWRKTSASLLEQLRDLSANTDLALEMLRGVRGIAQANRGEDP